MFEIRRRLLLGLIGPACWIASAAGSVAAPESAPESAPPVVRPVLSDAERIAILHDLRALATTGTVLHVGAHPDDENTQLIAWLLRGRGFRAGYLSLTRGDGGQNELGADFGEKLGVARTQELLAARRLDGGRQFFTRAIDFGFSKSPEETLAFWDREKVLGDVVRVIRKFRPDVIVTRFPIPPGSGGHGHHTSSGILAVEAFKIAGDPTAYPEQIAEGLTPWQPKRVLWNSWGGRGTGGLDGPIITVDIGGDDPVTGESFASIANESRAMHKTQGLGGFAGRGGGGPSPQSFMLLAGEPGVTDLMDGVDTTWARVPGGAGIGEMVDAVAAGFDAAKPAASVPALLEIRARLDALDSADPMIADRRAQLDRVVLACLGIGVELTIPGAEAVPGEIIVMSMHIWMREEFRGGLVAVRYLVNGRVVKKFGYRLNPDGISRPFDWSTRALLTIPAETALTQPYWLRETGSEGIARVSDPALIGTPENAPVVKVEHEFEIGGRPFVVASAPAFVAGEHRSPLAIVPPVSLEFGSEIYLLASGETRNVAVDMTAARAGASGTLRIDAPAGWSVAPSSQDFRIAEAGGAARFEFKVTAPAQAASGLMAAVATVGGKEFSNKREEVRYEHIPVQLLQPAATTRAAAFELSVLARKVGYLPGAGDSVAECLAQMGCSVRELTGADLTTEGLAGLDAVVIGVRAFNERDDLAASFPGLLAWVEAGGTVVAQYNRPNRLKATQLGPYPLSIEGNASAFRVTDETAPVRFLAADHPALNTPNKIAEADFKGWVQERGAYFPSKWDEASYTALLAMSDPGETQPDSSVLIARHGKGYYVYTGLAFFRQLPAGVPGAYRLFANLISLGQEGD